MGTAAEPASAVERWRKIARRVRVPLGFVVAAIFLVFAHSTWRTLLWSVVLVLPGLWLRGYAAGYVKKNAELTRTGPYAYTRNPLYLGSMSLAAGFAVAAGRWWLVVLLLAMFLFIYVPTILSEETYLRAEFAGFEEYTRRVPRLLPRLTAAKFTGPGTGGGQFSRERYLHHREYNALVGAAAIYAALVLRMLLMRGRS
ncbi:MAG TPA: isoprenylcysteine carboxylmethyltransferase family protein [Acidobacteriaceae bacterium]|jgi:protein-S-isoprenylcysteine O-methyltransferase Ste14